MVLSCSKAPHGESCAGAGKAQPVQIGFKFEPEGFPGFLCLCLCAHGSGVRIRGCACPSKPWCACSCLVSTGPTVSPAGAVTCLPDTPSSQTNAQGVAQWACTTGTTPGDVTISVDAESESPHHPCMLNLASAAHLPSEVDPGAGVVK